MKTNFIFSQAAPQRPLPSATQRSTTRHAFGVTLSTPSGIVRPYPHAQTVIRDSGKLFVYASTRCSILILGPGWVGSGQALSAG